MKEIIPYDIDGNIVTTLVQWDKDVFLTFRDDALTRAHPVHFFNRNSSRAFVVDSNYESGILSAKIPNILLRERHTLAGYIDIIDQNGERCLYGFKIRILPKPQPADVVYIDTVDYITLEYVLSECRDYASDASNSAVNAADSATTAHTMATKAEAAQLISKQNADSATASALASNEAKVASQEAAENSREYANVLAGYVGVITTSVGWDTDGYFSFFEYENDNDNETEEGQ